MFSVVHVDETKINPEELTKSRVKEDDKVVSTYNQINITIPLPITHNLPGAEDDKYIIKDDRNGPFSLPIFQNTTSEDSEGSIKSEKSITLFSPTPFRKGLYSSTASIMLNSSTSTSSKFSPSLSPESTDTEMENLSLTLRNLSPINSSSTTFHNSNTFKPTTTNKAVSVITTLSNSVQPTMVSREEVSVKSEDDTNKPFNQLTHNGVDVDPDNLLKEIPICVDCGTKIARFV